MRFIAGVLAFSTTVGCGSSPQPRFYALSPQPGPHHGSPVAVLEVREPSLPGYLDRTELVTSADQTRVHYSGADRWAEPFARMLCRVLAADLRARLPDEDVFAESSGISLHPDHLVELAIQRFDRHTDGHVSLVVQVVIDPTGEPETASMRTVTLTDTARGGTAELVASMNRLVGRLADIIAGLVATRGRAAAG